MVISVWIIWRYECRSWRKEADPTFAETSTPWPISAWWDNKCSKVRVIKYFPRCRYLRGWNWLAGGPTRWKETFLLSSNTGTPFNRGESLPSQYWRCHHQRKWTHLPLKETPTTASMCIQRFCVGFKKVFQLINRDGYKASKMDDDYKTQLQKVINFDFNHWFGRCSVIR